MGHLNLEIGHSIKFVILPVIILILFLGFQSVEGIDVDVSKLEIKVKTADVKYGGTDDKIYVKLNVKGSDRIDTTKYNDFERGDNKMYTLSTDYVDVQADIDMIEFSKDGTNGWCLEKFELFVNSVMIYNHVFSPCHFLDNEPSKDQKNYWSISGEALFNSPNWKPISPAIPVVTPPPVIPPPPVVISPPVIPPPEPKPEPIPEISVSTLKSSYTEGDTITISGNVSPLIPDEIIRIQVLASNGNMIVIDEVGTAGEGFTHTILAAGPLWQQDGTYTVRASYVTAVAESYFQFNTIVPPTPPPPPVTPPPVTPPPVTPPPVTPPPVTPPPVTPPPVTPPPVTPPPVIPPPTIPLPPTPTQLEVSADSQSYNVGDNVNLQVQLIGGGSGNVGITVTDPNGGIVLTRSILTSSNGVGSLSFKISNVPGSYTVAATSSILGNTLTDSSRFDVIGLPTGPNLDIVSVIASDQQGNQVSSFNPGKIGFAKVVVSTDSNVASLVTINLFGPDQTSLGIGSISGTIAPGQSDWVTSFFIPDGIMPGEGVVYANVFTDWPSVGGTPLTPELSGAVTISTSQGSTIPPSTTPVVPTTPSTTGPTTVEVMIPSTPVSQECTKNNSCFSPDPVTINVGDEVRWTNQNADPDYPVLLQSGTIQSSTDEFSSDLLTTGDVFTYTFTRAGTFDYFDIFHPWAKGKVIVR